MQHKKQLIEESCGILATYVTTLVKHNEQVAELIKIKKNDSELIPC